MSKDSVVVVAPSTPGADPTVQRSFSTVDEAWKWARERFADRRDLRWQDVVIRVGEKRITFAGPN